MHGYSIGHHTPCAERAYKSPTCNDTWEELGASHPSRRCQTSRVRASFLQLFGLIPPNSLGACVIPAAFRPFPAKAHTWRASKTPAQTTHASVKFGTEGPISCRKDTRTNRVWHEEGVIAAGRAARRASKGVSSRLLGLGFLCGGFFGFALELLLALALGPFGFPFLVGLGFGLGLLFLLLDLVA